jgi:hypothetical protein
MPVLLRSREVPLQVVLAVVIPAAAGALAGWLLGVNEVAYLVWSLLALLGGFFAGLEHNGAGEGAIRGVLGGAMFGAVLLLVHKATGQDPTAKLPDPEVVLVVLTAVIGTVAGALGGLRRARHEGAMAEAQQEGKSEQESEGGAQAPEAQTKQQQAARRAAEKAKEDKEKVPAFSLKRLHWAEYFGFFGAGLLALSLFLPWFATSCASKAEARASGAIAPHGHCNPNSVYNGMRGEFTAFQTFKFVDWLLVAACIAPFVLAYIVARQHTLSWKPGEVTMIVGMIATALILLNGVILGKPGDTADMSFRYGWLVGLAGAVIIMLSGILRQSLAPSERKPPGVM